MYFADDLFNPDIQKQHKWQWYLCPCILISDILGHCDMEFYISLMCNGFLSPLHPQLTL